MKLKQESATVFLAFLATSILLVCVFFQSRGVEGGLDSWNHFLISKSALKHPELLLDQWNKPVFTWCTVLICQLGLNALIAFNIICVLLSGLLLSFALQKQSFTNTWILIPFTVFTPILFQNTISGLTEPLNVLLLSITLYLWCSNHLKSAVILASFLPFVRTEGFVICGAVFLMILYMKQYKLIYWLLSGSFVMNLVGFLITGKVLWIITENPYWKHETEGTFEAGSGSLFHYVNQGRSIFGLPLELLFLLSAIIILYYLVKRKEIRQIVLLSFLIFCAYFMAHSIIYYFGILGSHGLTRVMAVIAPVLAVLAFFALDAVSFKLNTQLKAGLYFVLACLVIWTAYRETGYAKPHRISEASVKADRSQINFIKAGDWLIQNGLMSRPIIHQSPYFDVHFNKDPYDIKSSYRVWSIDQKHDWAEKGVVVIWDGFSAVREGNMKLEWLMQNTNYRLLHQIEGFEKPKDNPTMYDICIFEKITPP